MGRKEKKQEKLTNYDTIKAAIHLFDRHHLFGKIYRMRIMLEGGNKNKQHACLVGSDGRILLNPKYRYFLTEQEWFYIIVHQYLHLAFGHFDAEKMPDSYQLAGKRKGVFQERIWALACHLYNMKFLSDMKLGKCPFYTEGFEVKNQDENEIYESLLEKDWSELQCRQAEEIHRLLSMEGLRIPLIHKNGNPIAEEFAAKLAYAAKSVLTDVNKSEHIECSHKVKEAAEWFMSHYPLLGGLAAGFCIREDYEACQKMEIQTAAVDVEKAILYINPTANLTEKELRFVLAHEFLHAGLMHHERCQGRNFYLWNIACDYVINGWLYELQIGDMPIGILYDENYRGLSAEAIYDLLLQDIRKAMKLMTLRGYGKGDIIHVNSSGKKDHPTEQEEFYKNALKQGLIYHENQNRGYLPEGLIQEIRALGMPPIPWEVELARWFEYYFPLEEKRYSYARPSRRQSSSPEIPRPRLTVVEKRENRKTFGVIIDTSGSMSEKLLAMALGTIASYANSREVEMVRVVFCDARAYDAGYLSVGELAGRVEIKGRGGTVLQPGIDCLEKAKDFPKDGPILIITDGVIENHLNIKREHAYLLPKGSRLPFAGKGKIFYMSDK